MNKYNTNRLLIVYTANTAMKGKRGIIIFKKKKENVTKLKGALLYQFTLEFRQFQGSHKLRGHRGVKIQGENELLRSQKWSKSSFSIQYKQ